MNAKVEEAECRSLGICSYAASRIGSDPLGKIDEDLLLVMHWSNSTVRRNWQQGNQIYCRSSDWVRIALLVRRISVDCTDMVGKGVFL